MIMAITAPPATIFKAYDIRGIYGEEIDAATAHMIGRAFARVLARLRGKDASELRVGLGRDMRLSAPEMSASQMSSAFISTSGAPGAAACASAAATGGAAWNFTYAMPQDGHCQSGAVSEGLRTYPHFGQVVILGTHATASTCRRK